MVVGIWASLKRWFVGIIRRRTPSDGDPVAPLQKRSAASVAPRAVPDSDAFVKLAERYLGMRMADTALHVCQRGLEAHPGHLAGQALLARIYVAKGQRAEAQQLIDRLLRGHGEAPELAGLGGLLTSSAPAAVAAEAQRGAPPRAAGVVEGSRRELQALEAYLSRIRRELSRVGLG